MNYFDDRIGIGVAAPEYTLDAANRIRLRSGGSAAVSAGMWLNKTDNSGLQSFFGIENDTYAGIYGANGANWAFGINTTNGDAKFTGRIAIGNVAHNAPITPPCTVKP